ncbi:phospholipase D-like domain-containing protein [Desulfurispira natronophila]|uniref:Cardiolipin synthase n=1 Tax=Desulfurispira natronophila TaxID=682562 RepID=A0A7W7Y4C5_9BACT|nr:phospholipase D-like domain-containing protein [Desulfurispira natronophila]MBB5021699.1 cardiolipin synthase [Desulfurispira natronophila]
MSNVLTCHKLPYIFTAAVIAIVLLWWQPAYALPNKFSFQSAQVVPVFDDEYRYTFEQLVAHATDSIDLAIYLFKTDSDYRNSAAMLQESLILAAKRGVNVRVLFDLPDDPESFLYRSNLDTAKGLYFFGIDSYFDSAARMHSKMLVVDNRWTLMGSHNYTVSAMRYNRETSVLIDSETFAAESRQWISELVDTSASLEEILVLQR